MKISLLIKLYFISLLLTNCTMSEKDIFFNLTDTINISGTKNENYERAFLWLENISKSVRLEILYSDKNATTVEGRCLLYYFPFSQHIRIIKKYAGFALSIYDDYLVIRIICDGRPIQGFYSMTRMKRDLNKLINTFKQIDLNYSLQTFLYKGIRSGMSVDEFISYIKTNPEFKIVKFKIGALGTRTTFLGETYDIFPYFNKNQKLVSIIIMNAKPYKWTECDTNNIKKIIVDLYSLLIEKYGNAFYVEENKDNFLNLMKMNVPVIKPLELYFFRKNNMRVSVNIVRNNKDKKDKYHILINIYDTKYLDSDLFLLNKNLKIDNNSLIITEL